MFDINCWEVTFWHIYIIAIGSSSSRHCYPRFIFAVLCAWN